MVVVGELFYGEASGYIELAGTLLRSTNRMSHPEITLTKNAGEGRCDLALGLLLVEKPELINLFWSGLAISNLNGIDISFGVNRPSISKLARTDGETDIQLILHHGGRKLLLMIEDKIDAKHQPEQAERYINFGRAIVDQDQFAAARTALFAPEAYGKGTFTEFHAHVTYERIIEAYEKHETAAGDLTIQVLQKGIEKMGQSTDETVAALWDAYYELAAEIAPDLPIVKLENPTHGNTVLTFKSCDLSAGLKFWYASGSSGKQGHVCIVREAKHESDIAVMTRLAERDDIPEGLYPEEKSKSVFLKINTPPIEMYRPAVEQTEDLKAAIMAARRLYKWAHSTITADMFE